MRDEVLAEVNKRMTLNMLIQGAADHASLTSHHLVRDELNAIDPGLMPLYDKVATCLFLNMWYGENAVLWGHPTRFWAAIHRRQHPFSRHPLLARHGGNLTEATRVYLSVRAKEKGVSRLPVVQSFEMNWLITRIGGKESHHQRRLVELAKRATHLVWGIDEARLLAELTWKRPLSNRFGQLRTPSSFAGKVMRVLAAGYGGVVRADSQLMVMAKAWIWPLLSHELVKGTAELVCLHGLNTLERETYDSVMDLADRIEYEPWHMLAGGELWRRFLAVRPTDRPLPESLMQVALLAPQRLEELMLAVVEDPTLARTMLAGLGAAPESITGAAT